MQASTNPHLIPRLVLRGIRFPKAKGHQLANRRQMTTPGAKDVKMFQIYLSLIQFLAMVHQSYRGMFQYIFSLAEYN